ITASSSSSGKFADPTTTLPELPPWDSGLLPLELAPAAGLDDELEPLEHAATAARATAARAAIAPVAPVLVRIWVSFRTVYLFGSAGLCLAAEAGRDHEPVQDGEEPQYEDGEHDDEQCAAGHRTVLVARQAVDDEAAEAAEADVRGDRRGRHHEDRPGAQAGEDQRQRDRHLHARHLLP